MAATPEGWSALDEKLKAEWSDPHLVANYASREGLTPAESGIFREYLRPEARVLDIGIGAGRTTSALKEQVRSYVGIDYSESMINAARARHPGVDLRVADAADLSAWEADRFDVLLFSYNGIDSLHPSRKRRRFLAEARRVLRPAGLLIFSTHNPRYLLDSAALRPGIPVRLRLGMLGRSLAANAPRLLTGAFWRGHGYQDDRTGRGAVCHSASPRSVRKELAVFGFVPIVRIAATHPEPDRPGTAPWNYFVFRAGLHAGTSAGQSHPGSSS